MLEILFRNAFAALGHTIRAHSKSFHAGAACRPPAESLVSRGFEQLRELIPKRPKRAALGLRPRDKYWLHMFDALALSLAVQRESEQAESSSGPLAAASERSDEAPNHEDRATEA